MRRRSDWEHVAGGGQNCAAYVKNGAKKAAAPNDIIPRVGGRCKGSVIFMAALGLSSRGNGTFRSVPKRDRVNSENYQKTIKDLREPDCHEHYGAPHGRRFQQGGASFNTSNVAHRYCSPPPTELPGGGNPGRPALQIRTCPPTSFGGIYRRKSKRRTRSV